MQDTRKDKGVGITKTRENLNTSLNMEISSTSNRFTIPKSVAKREEVDLILFNMVEPIDEERVVGLRKSHATPTRVVDLMKTFKPRNKRVIKGKNKQVKVGSSTFGGQNSSPSL